MGMRWYSPTVTGPLTSLSGQGMGYIVYLIFVSATVIVHLLGMYVGKLQLLNLASVLSFEFGPRSGL